MPGIVPGIHVGPIAEWPEGVPGLTTWMAGTSPAMTARENPIGAYINIITMCN
ncbi:hypothetical protein XFLAVUS301_00330 [Xanthobacter flavus]|uniref:Uncharacterized protein n=1 Tax=Xanthobacter flavus TaxID=281 RepID=A0A9W6CGQ9_XANFL|nr:hypothetical protein XFLAVUS301_00330 [Xanthobacter flavus]